MCKLINFLLLFMTVIASTPSSAFLSMELTRGVAGAIPIAIVPFATAKVAPSQDISNIIISDLQHSGRFKVFGPKILTQFPHKAEDISIPYFRHLGTDNIVIGQIISTGFNQYQISFQLLETYRRAAGGNNIVINKRFTVTDANLRQVAHRISDLIYQQLTGLKGVFSTKLAYVVIKRQANGHVQYILEVADQDGYNPRPLLTSYEPIMSPAWSPSGKQIAYVSFENQRAGIFIEEVSSGKRQLLSIFPGINGAPAWSPDGKKMAIVLSKSGSPNIYVVDLASHKLTQVTKDAYINTEPAWSPDNKSLIFTSNRTGSPQIYQANLMTGSISRLSYAGDYNARASFTRDGKFVAMIHRVSGIYNIGLLNLSTGITKVLITSAIGDSSSPSIAPNGSMVLYDTVYRGQNVLGMVSADGRIQLVLPARNGEAQDPAWSPFLS